MTKHSDLIFLYDFARSPNTLKIMSSFTFCTVMVLLRAMRRKLAVENFFHSYIRDFKEHDISETTDFLCIDCDNINDFRDGITRPIAKTFLDELFV